MKFIAISTALLAASVSSFTPNKPSFSRSTSLQATSSRKEFFAQVAGAVAFTAVLPGDALAIGPPKKKISKANPASPGIIDVNGVVLNKEVFGSILVQQAVKDITDYSAIVTEMKNTLAEDPQVDLNPIAKKIFDYGKVRADIEELQTAFDTKTQKTTKILADILLVDLKKLEDSTIKLNDGTEKGNLDVKTVTGLLDKIYYSFDEILQCAKTEELV